MNRQSSRGGKWNGVPAAGLAALLDELIDYAGLFPPAGLEMKPAIETHARFLSGACAPMLSRFVLPWIRFGEFLIALERLKPAHPLEFHLSVLHPVAESSVIESIVAFNSQLSPRLESQARAIIHAIELKPRAPQDILEAAKQISPSINSYYEIPLNAECPEFIGAVKESGGHAKIRTGGLTADSIPPAHEVARFLTTSAKAELSFKATAGLHHPMRSLQPLTYEPSAPQAVMHGFINLFLAAAQVYCGASSGDALNTLEETDPGAFHFDHSGVRWHQTELSTGDIERSRKHFAISLGSCSLSDPVMDLKALGWLKQP